MLATLVRANRAIDDASRGKADVSCASALPKDLGDWAATVEFLLGANATGKDLKELSAIDKIRAQDRSAALACRQGLGTLIAKLGEGLPVSLATPATRISWSGRDVTRGNAGRQDRRPRRHRHRVEQCADLGRTQVHAGSSQAHARCCFESQPRQLRPHCAASAGQSARAFARRCGDRAEQGCAHRVHDCQHGRIVAVLDRCRGLVRPRSLRAGRSRRWWRSRWSG